MKKRIELLLAVAAFIGGELETQADVLVLKRYPTGWQKQSLVSNEQRNIHNQNDGELLEIVFLKDDDPKHQTVYLNGCVNLTNIVILDANMTSTYFVAGENKLKNVFIPRIVASKTRVYESLKPVKLMNEIIKPIENYRKIWLFVDVRKNDVTDRNEHDLIIAWSGGFLEHDHELTDNPPGNEPGKIEYDKIDLDDREHLVRDREFGFVTSSKNRRRNDLRSYYTQSGFFRLKPQE